MMKYKIALSITTTVLIAFALIDSFSVSDNFEEHSQHSTLLNDSKRGVLPNYFNEVSVNEKYSHVSLFHEKYQSSDSRKTWLSRSDEREKLAELAVARMFRAMNDIQRPIDNQRWGVLRSEILNELSNHPSAITLLLATYAKINSDFHKSLLRDIFLYSDTPVVEDVTAENLVSSIGLNNNDWFNLAKTIGFKQAHNQNLVLEHLRYVDTPEQLVMILSSLQPVENQGLSSIELIEKLEQFVYYPDENVQSEAIRKIGQWADADQHYFVEQALSDSSKAVRESAIQSLVASGHKSDVIKIFLLKTLTDQAEDWNLRIQAHNALTEYALFDDERAAFIDFSRQRTNPPARSGEG